MVITLNGKQVELEKETGLIDFLVSNSIDPSSVIVEYNFNIIKNEEWSSIVLKENDALEVLRFVGGG